MKHCYVLIFGFLLACNQQTDNKEEARPPRVINDTIPERRENVQTRAVARYSEKVKDPLNDWNFAVEIFETPQTFKYLMTIEYKELNETDTLTIPNFGIMPKPEIQKGKDELTVIVGFKDKDDHFREYKKVGVTNQQLKISTLRRYTRTRYKVK